MMPDLPPLTSASDAVALLTVRLGEPDLEMVHQALLGITRDVGAWPAILWMADVNLSLLSTLTPDVADAIRRIGVAVA